MVKSNKLIQLHRSGNNNTKEEKQQNMLGHIRQDLATHMSSVVFPRREGMQVPRQRDLKAESCLRQVPGCSEIRTLKC